jgi:hypothetical protein
MDIISTTKPWAWLPVAKLVWEYRWPFDGKSSSSSSKSALRTAWVSPFHNGISSGIDFTSLFLLQTGQLKSHGVPF